MVQHKQLHEKRLLICFFDKGKVNMYKNIFFNYYLLFFNKFLYIFAKNLNNGKRNKIYLELN